MGEPETAQSWETRVLAIPREQILLNTLSNGLRPQKSHTLLTDPWDKKLKTRKSQAELPVN